MIIGIGCDITKIQRFAARTDALARRILTKNEYNRYDTYDDFRRIEFLAGRFAAKEAIIKAVNQQLFFHDIEIENFESGKLACHLKGYCIHISIAHEKEYAIAYAICEKGA